MSNSVTKWIAGLKGGDSEAVLRLFERYWDFLVAAAQTHLNNKPRPLGDEEDLAQSVLISLCRGAADGRLNGLANRDELWGLLLSITQRKAIDRVRYHNRLKRGGGRVANEADLAARSDDETGFRLDQLKGSVPTPEFLVLIEEETGQLLGLLRDESLCQIAIWRMEGFTVTEIADKIGKGTRTVERKLELIRKTWATQIGS